MKLKSGHIIIDKINGKTEEELGKSDSNVSLEATSNNDIVEIIGKTENSIEIKAEDTVGNAQITVTYGNLEPKKGNKMKPIKWEGIEEVVADETNKDYKWYQYIGQEDTKDNNNSHWSNAKTGIISYELEPGIETVENEQGDKYIVHPAFGTTKTDETSKTQNIELGGWDKALTGFWFAKFEMSGTDSTTLTSVPGVKSQRSKGIGIYYKEAREATYGQTGSVDSFDNTISFMNSHMSKNSEWRSSSIFST